MQEEERKIQGSVRPVHMVSKQTFCRLADSGPLFFDLAETKEIGYYKLYEKDNQLLATGGCYGKE